MTNLYFFLPFNFAERSLHKFINLVVPVLLQTDVNIFQIIVVTRLFVRQLMHLIAYNINDILLINLN